MSINNWHRVLQMIVLIFAGELVFSLPFHLARFFRPSFLELFNLSNTNLGDVFAVYGLTAMVSYFFGGVIADKISGDSYKFDLFSKINHFHIPGGDFMRRPLYSSAIFYYKLRDIIKYKF